MPILVVEDDASTRGLLSTLLTDAGFNVVVAETGQRAIDPSAIVQAIRRLVPPAK